MKASFRYSPRTDSPLQLVLDTNSIPRLIEAEVRLILADRSQHLEPLPWDIYSSRVFPTKIPTLGAGHKAEDIMDLQIVTNDDDVENPQVDDRGGLSSSTGSKMKEKKRYVAE